MIMSYEADKLENLVAFVFSEHADGKVSEDTATEIVRILREVSEKLNLAPVSLAEQGEATVCDIDDYCPNKNEKQECKVPKGMCAYQQTGN